MEVELTRKTLARRLLNAGFQRLPLRDRARLALVTRRLRIARNIQKEFDDRLTFGQRLADQVASFGGSWSFIIIFGAILVSWVFTNTALLGTNSFDPYPFIFLNLILSMIAAIQAPVIMMSQNRQSAKDRMAMEHDFDVNLKAELEIMALHDKFDALNVASLSVMMVKQQDQIEKILALVETMATPRTVAA
jgi:uncharacterized membrane protein